jgi:hypothetical protein
MVNFKKMLQESNDKDFWDNIMGRCDCGDVPEFADWYKASR